MPNATSLTGRSRISFQARSCEKSSNGRRCGVSALQGAVMASAIHRFSVPQRHHPEKSSPWSHRLRKGSLRRAVSVRPLHITQRLPEKQQISPDTAIGQTNFVVQRCEPLLQERAHLPVHPDMIELNPTFEP